MVVFLAIAIVRIGCYLKNILNKSKKETRDMTEIYKFGYLLTVSSLIIFIGELYLI